MTNYERWQFYLKDIESPDIYIEWGFYSLISAALQRRVWYYGDPITGIPNRMSLFTGLFAWLIGPPSTGKGRVINGAMSVVQSSKLEVPDEQNRIIPLIPASPDAVTLEAMTQHMAEHTKAKTFKITKREGGGWDYHDIKHPVGDVRAYAYSPCAFWVEELEVLFKTQSHDMVAALCHMYDAHDLHYKTKTQGEDKLKNICVTMMAGSTAESIADLAQQKIIKKGLSSRAIMIFADKPRFFRQFPGISDEQQIAFNELIGHIKLLTNVVGEIRLSAEAAAWHKSEYESGNMNKNRVNTSPYLDYYYGRRNVHGLKLAACMMFGESIDDREISLEILQRAYTRLSVAEVNMHQSFNAGGRNPLYDSAIAIERYLMDPTRPADGVRYAKVWWDHSRDLKKEEFEATVELLKQVGKIDMVNGNIMLKKVQA